MIQKYTFLALIPVLLFLACTKDNPVADPSLGDVDPNVYVAIGNSFTAGFQSGALYQEAQEFSFPNLLARQIGSTPFEQPRMPYPGTGELRVLRSLHPQTEIVTDGVKQNIPTNTALPRPFNNLGLPGAIAADAIDDSDVMERAVRRSNPFYPLIMRDQSTHGVSLVEQAIALQPTILTFWLGHDDVYRYALSGGTEGSNTGLGGEPQGTLPTERAVFQQVIQEAFARIRAALPDAKVLVGNIPDVMSFPYFTTIPGKLPYPPDNPTQQMSIYYRNGAGNVTTVTENDFVLLTAQEYLLEGVGLSPTTPLNSRFVLDVAEVSVVLEAMTSFNSILMAEAERNGFILVDIYEMFDEVSRNGYMVAGEEYTMSFISGGLFSLDGVHLSSRGNAILANKFIQAMNENLNANIRYVSLHTIPGITAPTGKAMRF